MKRGQNHFCKNTNFMLRKSHHFSTLTSSLRRNTDQAPKTFYVLKFIDIRNHNRNFFTFISLGWRDSPKHSQSASGWTPCIIKILLR